MAVKLVYIKKQHIENERNQAFDSKTRINNFESGDFHQGKISVEFSNDDNSKTWFVVE